MPNSVFIPHDTWTKRASDHNLIRAAFSLRAESPVTGYSENLMVLYDATHRPIQRGYSPPRINAARFYPQDIHAYGGQTVILTGIVRRVEETRGTGLLRFFLGHGDSARAFRVILWVAFRDVGIRDIAGYYGGKMAQAVGALHFYQGHPEIAVQTPRQFRMIAS